VFVSYYFRSLPLPLGVEILKYIDPYTVYLRLTYSTLIAFIISYYLDISSYLLGRRRASANSRARCAVFRILANLIIF
jgi:hypothetical protein